MRCFFLFLLSFSILLPALEPSSLDPREYTLENGIQVYLWPSSEEESALKRHQTICLRLAVPVGSVYEEEEEQGFAHFVEHLLFHGTRSFSKERIETFLKKIDGQLGPDMNAHTSFDQTIYQINLPLHKVDLLPEALALLAEFGEWATFEERAVEIERQIVLEERRMRLGTEPHRNRVLAALLQETRYLQRSPIGKERILQLATPGQLRAFYQKWYPKVPLGLILTGNFQPDEVAPLIEEAFSQLSERCKREELPYFSYPYGQGLRPLVTQKRGRAPSSCTLYFPLATTHPRTMEEYLQEEAQGSLFLALYEQRLQQHAPQTAQMKQPLVGKMQLVQPYSFLFLGTTFSEGNEEILEIFSSLSTTLRSLQEGPCRREELEAAKELLLARLKKVSRLNQAEEAPERRAEYAIHLFSQDLSFPSTELFLEAIDTLTPDDLAAFARRLNLAEDCLAHFSLTSPEQQPITSWELIERLLISSPATALSQQPTPSPRKWSVTPHRSGRIVAEKHDSETQITEYELENGMRLLHKEVSAPTPYLILKAVAPGGISSFPPEERAAALLAAPLLNRSGLGSYSTEELHTLPEPQEGYLYRNLAPYFREVVALSSNEAPERLFEFLYLGFAHPRCNQDAFHELHELLTMMTILQTNAPASLLPLTQATRFLLSDHPLFAPLSLQELEGLTYSSLQKAATRAFGNPSDFTLSLTGSLPPEKVRALAERYLASIPNQHPTWTKPLPLALRTPSQMQEQIEYVDKEERGTLQLFLPIRASSLSSEGIAHLDGCQMIIADRLQKYLRGQLQATYQVQVFYDFLWPMADQGALVVTFTCDPNKIFAMKRNTLAELKRLRDEGILEREVARLVRMASRRIDRQSEDVEFWLERMIQATLLKWEEGALGDLFGPWQKLTPPSLNRQLQEMLPLNRGLSHFTLPESHNQPSW